MKKPKPVPKWVMNSEIIEELKKINNIKLEHEIIDAFMSSGIREFAFFTQKEYYDFTHDEEGREIYVGAKVIAVRESDDIISISPGVTK